jgi:hypothetical protein
MEKVVESIERQLVSADGVMVESPKRLRDKDTGRLREHDIVITRQIAHHEPILIAIECKDRSRPIDVDKIEAFKIKCDRTGIHHGVIVSATGFTEAAKLKAKSQGLRCLNIQDVDELTWIAPQEFRSFGRHHVGTQMMFSIGEENDSALALPFIVVREDGSVIDYNAMQSMGYNVLTQLPFVPVTGHHPEAVFDQTVDAVLNEPVFLIDALGSEFISRKARVTVLFQAVAQTTELSLYKYVDSADQRELSTAAVTDMEVGIGRLLMTMTGPSDGEKQISVRLAGRDPDPDKQLAIQQEVERILKGEPRRYPLLRSVQTTGNSKTEDLAAVWSYSSVSMGSSEEVKAERQDE